MFVLIENIKIHNIFCFKQILKETLYFSFHFLFFIQPKQEHHIIFKIGRIMF